MPITTEVVISNSAQMRCTRYNIMWYKVCQWLVPGRWFSSGTLVSSTNKTDRHKITEILLKVALNTINQTWWKDSGLRHCEKKSSLRQLLGKIEYKVFYSIFSDNNYLVPVFPRRSISTPAPITNIAFLKILNLNLHILTHILYLSIRYNYSHAFHLQKLKQKDKLFH